MVSVTQRVAVTGGLLYTDRSHLYAILDALEPTELAHGGAVGADTLAGDWARERGVPCRAYDAPWRRARRWGGSIRNGFMLDDFRPSLLVVFQGDRGTMNCFGQAQERGLRTLLACSPAAVEALRSRDPGFALRALIR